MKLNVKGLVFVGFAAAILSGAAKADDKQIVTSKSFTEATYQKKIGGGDNADKVVIAGSTAGSPTYKAISNSKDDIVDNNNKAGVLVDAQAIAQAIGDSQTATTYTAGTGIDITGNVVTNEGVLGVSASDASTGTNGTISVTKLNAQGQEEATEVAVKGLDTAAYKAYTTDDTLAVSAETGKLPTAATVKNYVDNKVKDGTFSITVGNGTAQTFTANSASNTTVTVPMMSAESAASAGDGVNGLVTAAAYDEIGKFLKGDGTWDVPADTTYSADSTTITLNPSTNTFSATTGDVASNNQGLVTGATVYTYINGQLVPVPGATCSALTPCSLVATGATMADVAWVQMAQPGSN